MGHNVVTNVLRSFIQFWVTAISNLRPISEEKLPLLLTLDFDLQISGTFKIDGSGNVELKEEDGIDYAAVTVQLPGGERVPFLFTIKELEAKGTADAFGGDFVVPSYRGSSFLDPKVWFTRGKG